MEIKNDGEKEGWTDISTLLNDACNDFSMGQMLKRENFGLMEAMSALEIMDPKMDSGVNYDKFHTLDEKLELGLLPLPDDNLSLHQVISIQDHLLSCQMMWFSGLSLCQTVFSCLYLHQLPLITNHHLEAFCKTVLKTCDSIRTLVMRADVHEEEDFISHTFGFSLCENVLDEVLSTLLKENEEHLTTRIKAAKAEKKEELTEEILCCEAILARMRFVRAFYMVQIHFDKPQCKGIESAKKSIQFALSQLEQMKKTGKALADLQEKKKEKEGESTESKSFIDAVFDGEIGRRFQAPTPSRVIPIIPFTEALVLFEKMLQGLEQVVTLASLATNPATDTLAIYLEFFSSFSATNPDIVLRSRLQLLFQFNRKVFGKTPLSEYVKESLVAASIPKIIVDNAASASFVEKATSCMLQNIRLFGFNRARQRRRIVHLLEEWAGVQQQAIQLDEEIGANNNEGQRIGYFNQWHFERVTALMIHFLQLGFELELYHPSEYAMIYWYIDYLCGVRLQNNVVITQLAHDSSSTQKTKKKVNKKRADPPPITPEQLYLEANMALSRGIFRTVYVLHCMFPEAALPFSPLVASSFPFGSQELRFYYRFGCFHKLAQPMPLLFSHFQETTDHSNLTIEQLLEGATECFKQTKLCVEKLVHSHNNKQNPLTSHGCLPASVPKLQALGKVAITNLVQLQIVVNMKEEQRKDKKPTLNYSVHPFYPTISLS